MTDQCPVCLGENTQLRDRDYGDKRRVNCLRCGPFEISGTALSMLDGRLRKDHLARARLSHAIRINTSDKNRLFITSANLDELAKQPLPGIPQQLEYLARWLAGQLGEDRLGRVPGVFPELVAGVIGAADGNRVERLIEHAAGQGIVERDTDKDALGLTPKGWEMVEPPKKDKEPKPQPVASTALPEVVQGHCNKCGGERDSFRRATHTVKGEAAVTSRGDGTSWSDTYDVLECCGCHELSVRRELWFSEWDNFDFDPLTGEQIVIPGVSVTYWPPPTKRKKPEWTGNLDDDVLRNVIGEVYQALNLGLIVLASVGIRTLLDRAMLLRVGDVAGGFGGKLKAMLEEGHVGEKEKGILEIITDAGSASAHRGFAPDVDTLNTIVQAVENFLQREFVLKAAAEKVKAATPPRATPTKKS